VVATKRYTNLRSIYLTLIVIKLMVIVQVGPNAIQVTSSEKSKVLGHSVLLNDVYYAAEIEEVSVLEIYVS